MRNGPYASTTEIAGEESLQNELSSNLKAKTTTSYLQKSYLEVSLAQTRIKADQLLSRE